MEDIRHISKFLICLEADLLNSTNSLMSVFGFSHPKSEYLVRVFTVNPKMAAQLAPIF